MKYKIAELIGILLGDGCLSLKSSGQSQNRLKISFNSKDDKEYISYVRELIRDIFNTEPILKFRHNENTADLFIFKKKIIDYLIDEIGLKLSPKWGNAIIPEEYTSKELGLLVIRGYFDTDGSVVLTNNNGTLYPRLEMKISPSPMQQQFIQILQDNGFKFGVYQIGRGKVRVQLNGKGQLTKWRELIGFSNIKHTNKMNKVIK